MFAVNMSRPVTLAARSGARGSALRLQHRPTSQHLVARAAENEPTTQGSAESRPEEQGSSSSTAPASTATATSASSGGGLEKELNKFTRQTASTFAPRSSTAQKNPAQKGTLLYDIFEWQAWLALCVGGLLSFNVIYPTEEPSIARLLGMWSIWMFTVPSLRAKECFPKEKEALNYLFLAIPVVNVTLPFVWKDFGFIFTADVLVMLAFYTYKGVWREVYNLPIDWPFATADGGSDGGNKQ